MQEASMKKNISVLTHLLSWALLGFIVFLFTPLTSKLEFPTEFWIKQGLILGLLVSAFYFNYLYFIPKTLFNNQVKKFIFVNLLLGIIFLGILFLYDEWTNMAKLMHEVFRPGTAYIPRKRNLSYDFYNFLIYAMAVGISTTIAAVQKWQSDEKVRLQLEKEKTDSELSYLKAQINPHFFFNTLNNIYSLTNIDVEKAKTALLKLSRMMRYVLYETERNHTLLSKEIDFIKDFIELMRLRLSSKVKLEINIPEQIEEAEIAPMILLPFIENCFKHGISSQQESPISITIQKGKNSLILITKNRIFRSSENTPEGEKSGIGLANTQRRLDLLYPNRYKLKIEESIEDQEFIVELSIILP